MFCAANRKPVYRIMSDHFGDRVKRIAELAQYELARFPTLLDLHVHEAASAPETYRSA